MLFLSNKILVITNLINVWNFLVYIIIIILVLDKAILGNRKMRLDYDFHRYDIYDYHLFNVYCD